MKTITITITITKTFKLKALTAACLTIGAVNSPAVFAQGSGLALEEVVVTAQKREESVQDVPVAVSAFGEAQIENLGISDVGNLAMVSPSLSIQEGG